MELGLIKCGEAQITPSGALYLEKMADTLHRVRRYRMRLINGEEKELSHDQYEAISDALMKLGNSSRFFKFKDGSMISSGQIVSIKPYEVIVDVRKERL